ncbi:MAG: DUF3489 domain-containing protein [Bryobacteraceae bacterium]
MTFTIDDENNITAHGTPEEAVAATATPFDSFSTQKEFAELAKAWPAERVVAIWNSLPGVTPVESFKSTKAAISRIWARIQGLGETAKPAAEQAKPKAKRKAKAGARAAKVAPAKAKAGKKASPARKAPTSRTKAKVDKPEARGGSKTAKILDLLKRPGGVTSKELMKATGWQSHSVRGFLSGAIRKKMGLTVMSTKREDGERSYSVKA